MFEEFITNFFMWCVYILQVIGGAPEKFGFGYYLVNIVIFVFFATSFNNIIFYSLEKREEKEQ